MNAKNIFTALILILLGLSLTMAEEQNQLEQTVKNMAAKELIPAPAKVISNRFNRMGMWRSAPAPPEAAVKPQADSAEIVRSYQTLLANIEQNKDQLDKEDIISLVKGLTKQMKKKVAPAAPAASVAEPAAPRLQARVRSKTPRTFSIPKAVKKAAAPQPPAVNLVPDTQPALFSVQTPPADMQVITDPGMQLQLADPAADPTSVSFNTSGEELKGMIEKLRDASGVNFVVDTNAISRGIASGTVRTSITLKVENMTFKNALNWICRLSGLRWTLKDEAVYITTPDRIAGNDVQLKVYDVRDMQAPIPDFPAPGVAFGRDGEGFSPDL